jgi:hypothetical protein
LKDVAHTALGHENNPTRAFTPPPEDVDKKTLAMAMVMSYNGYVRTCDSINAVSGFYGLDEEECKCVDFVVMVGMGMGSGMAAGGGGGQGDDDGEEEGYPLTGMNDVD